MNFAKLRDSGSAANGCKATFVDVMKIASWFSLQVVRNISGRRLSLLDGSWRDARDELAIFIFERSQISNYENLGMPGNAQIGINQHAPRAVHRRSKFLTQGRCGYSRGP